MEATDALPLVSVVMPVYNACRTDPRFLAEAVRSVCEQTYPRVELIIVDDGSTDDTRNQCEQQIRAFPGVAIRVVVQEHAGQSSARNHGIREARGALVAFLDQDDVWYPDKLERVVPLVQPGVDMVYTDADTIAENGDLIMTGIHRNHGYGWPNPKRDVEDILFVNAIVMPGVMTMRRELLLRVGGFDEALSGYEDDDLFLRLFQAGSIAYLPLSTLKWRRHDEAYSLTERHVRSRVLYWQKLLAHNAGGGRDVRRAAGISTRFFRESLGQAGRQMRAGNPLWQANLAAAQEMAVNLRGLERLVFGRHAAGWCRSTARSKLLRYVMERWWRLFPVRRR
jgi:glycosyltransferase involved in cell wall biosynthesis